MWNRWCRVEWGSPAFDDTTCVGINPTCFGRCYRISDGVRRGAGIHCMMGRADRCRRLTRRKIGPVRTRKTPRWVAGLGWEVPSANENADHRSVINLDGLLDRDDRLLPTVVITNMHLAIGIEVAEHNHQFTYRHDLSPFQQGRSDGPRRPSSPRTPRNHRRWHQPPVGFA